MGKIVVGVDGSEGSDGALLWAEQEAKLRGATLYLLHSWQFPPALPAPTGGMMSVDIEGTAKQILADAQALLDGSVPMETQISSESPGRCLVKASEQADLVVVGSRGRGGFKGLLLGSVSQQVAQHAHCPIVIVPGDRRA